MMTKPPGYVAMVRLLNRYIEKKIVERLDVRDKDAPFFYRLTEKHAKENKIERLVAPNKHNWKHEMHGADLYVSFYLTGLLKDWWVTPQMRNGLRPDRVAFMLKMLFVEVDEGTEDHKKIKSKLPMYAELYRLKPDQEMYVIFTAPTKQRASNILFDDLAPVNRGYRYLVGVQSSIVESPLGAVLASPKDPTKWLSVTDLNVNQPVPYSG